MDLKDLKLANIIYLFETDTLKMMKVDCYGYNGKITQNIIELIDAELKARSKRS
jgi:hypothetical protein